MGCRMLDENASVYCRGTERTTHIIRNANRKKKKNKFSFFCKIQEGKQVILSQLRIIPLLFNQIDDKI